jgi:integrase
MKGTELVRGGAAELVAVVDVPADRSPYFVYLARLGTADSRRVQADALARIAALLTGGAVPASAFDWGALRYPHAAAVRSRLAERYEPRTVRRMLSALRGVLREAWRLGAMSAEDFARASDLAPVKGTTLPAGRALPAGEIRSLFAHCRGPLGARDAALLAVAYGAGLRRSEAVALDLEDFDPETGALSVRHGKGNRARTSYLTNGALSALKAWLVVRGLEPGALFVAMTRGGRATGRRLTDAAVAKAFAACARRAAVATFSPHDLRRSFVSDLLDAGADVATVARLAGHANVQTTTVYDRRPEAAKRKAAELLHVPYSPAGA